VIIGFLSYVSFRRSMRIQAVELSGGRLTRHDAIKMVNMHGGKFPSTYLGYSITEILKDIDMTVKEFTAICDRFTNKKLFNCIKIATNI
jgi:hypothetical protein